ncbi:RhoGAP domain containing protein [Histomonas meleagridis]|uniref:RhoGAP domain containing protein n=1 Tax=Histomonas meleagridis TaxID=135588 RepID=UPI00355949B2|nr:RhoGAP domain containing protein [Histomonas meleagridis]KAH0806892.1 RhoGAP domain containing protein [Histomonas meleagridis]
MSEQNVYYIYKHNGEPYYFNAKTEERTWDFPTDGVVIDPNTHQYILNPNTSRRRTSTFVVSHKKKPDVAVEHDDKKKKKPHKRFNKRIITKKAGSPLIPKPTSVKIQEPVSQGSTIDPTSLCSDNGKPLYYPKSFDSDLKNDDISKLFQSIVEEKKGRKSSQSYGFQDKPLIVPFLKHDKNVAKTALRIFKCILMYTGVKSSKKVDGTINQFVEFVKKDSSLINETYLYLLKQTNTIRYDTAFVKTLELFHVMISTFVPSKEYFPYILGHLARISTNSSNESAKDLAFYIYIRAISQFTSETPITVPLDQILTDSTKSTRQFNVSLPEIMFSQQRTNPNLPIPIFLYKIISELLSKDCLHTHGIFRLSGKTVNLDQYQNTANSGDFSFLASIDVYDLSSLFKSWIRSISGAILTKQLTERLVQSKKEQYMDIVNAMDVINRNVLMYLVGFLKKQQETSEETKMDIGNLAMVFSLNIIYPTENPDLIVRLQTAASAFVEFLINEWDTSPLYPLPNVFKI